MEGRKQNLAMVKERMREIKALAAAFGSQEKRPSGLWIAEYVGTISVCLANAQDTDQRADTLAVFAIAMWQAGYEAAPKLEFVLPEGGMG